MFKLVKFIALLIIVGAGVFLCSIFIDKSGVNTIKIDVSSNRPSIELTPRASSGERLYFSEEMEKEKNRVQSLEKDQAKDLQENTAPSSPVTAVVDEPRIHGEIADPIVKNANVIDRKWYKVFYNESRKSPDVVRYTLKSPSYSGHYNRDNLTFQTDFKTSSHVSSYDYNNSGFDRGHMAPAYAMFISGGEDGLKESFFMSNVIPQVKELNRGPWENLEGYIAGRKKEAIVGLHEKHGSTTVFCGPIYDQNPQKLRNGTWIPTACFMLVYVPVNGTTVYKAWEMPNSPKITSKPLRNFETTIDNIEKKTKIVFSHVEQGQF